MQPHIMEPQHRSQAVKVTASRRQLDNRFPSLCFFVETGGHPFFELLLTSDRGLFDPARAGDRQAGNFYSSREDVGLLDARDGSGAFHVPPVVLRNFAQQVPHPDHLYYVAIAYASEQGNEPLFSHPPETLPDAAESIRLADNFTGATLSQVLGTHAERLKTVGARPPGPGGLPLYPVPVYREGGQEGNQEKSHEESNHTGNGVQSRAEPLLPVPSQENDINGARENNGSHGRYGSHGSNGTGGNNGHYGRHGSNGSNGATPIHSAPEHSSALPDAELDYDDGFGDPDDNGPTPPSQAAPDAMDGYGDEDYDQPPPARHGDARETNGAYNGNGNKKNGTSPQSPMEQSPMELPDLDAIDGVTAQSLEKPLEKSLESNGTQPAPAITEPDQHSDQGTAKAELSDAGKRRLIERVASLEHGEPRYAAINPDGEFKGRFGRDNPYYQRAHVGLSYGIGPFTQDSGTLGQLLHLMHQRDSTYFETVFGPHWQELLQVTNASGPGSLETESGRSARVQPVAGSDLWESDWLERFRLAGSHPPFQAAQNQLAAELFLAPAQALAGHLGLASERGIALLYDHGAQMGVAEARNHVLDQLSPIKTEAQRSAALAFVMAGQEDASLASFQRSVGLHADGQWNTPTHARLLGALRAKQQRGQEAPLPLPGYEEMLDALVSAARGRPWEQRLSTLRTDPELSDAPYLA